MNTMSRRRLMLAAGAATALPTALALAQEPRFLRIGSGPIEGNYFSIATLIGSVVSSPPGARDCARGGSCGVPGLIALTQSTAGSVANLDLIGGGRIESGLCQADIAYWAFHGTGLYQRGGVRNLRAIANLYPEAMHVVTKRGGPSELRQLRGRDVALGARDSGTLATARSMLRVLGLQERDVKPQYLGPVEAAEALAAGRVQALFEMTGAPSGTIQDLAKDHDVALMPIAGMTASRLRGAFPFFAETTIPEGLYRGVPATPSLAVGALWVVAAELEEAVVHGLTRALFHPNNRRALDTGHAFGKLIRLETALDGIALQVHPGAALHYFEAGLIK
jgi:TRAP transporter TAXI family solute receptor